MPDKAPKRKVVTSSLVGLAAQALREQAPVRYFMMETYGPDGEILESSECHPLDGTEEVQAVIITGHGFAEPRTDWRARGVVPPRGFHRYGERRVP